MPGVGGAEIQAVSILPHEDHCRQNHPRVYLMALLLLVYMVYWPLLSGGMGVGPVLQRFYIGLSRRVCVELVCC